MEMPENVIAAANAAAAKYQDDVDKAVEALERTLRRMPGFLNLVDDLINHAVRDLIHQARCRSNARIKSHVGCMPKVIVGHSTQINEVYGNVYSYCIGTRSLGSTLVRDLPNLANNERLLSNGHAINAQWLDKIYDLAKGKEDMTVAEAVPEKKAAKILEDLQGC